MNPEQLLNSVEECIKERPKLDAKLWVIVWHENRLKCIPDKAKMSDMVIFAMLHVDDLTQGLTIKSWSNIAKKITEFFENKTHTPLPKSVTELKVIKNVKKPTKNH